MNLPCTFQTAQLIENLRIVLNFSSQSSKHTIYFATLPFLLEPFIVFVSFYTEKTVVIRQISTKLVSLFKTIDSKHQRMSRIFSIMLETNPHPVQIHLRTSPQCLFLYDYHQCSFHLSLCLLIWYLCLS